MTARDDLDRRLAAWFAADAAAREPERLLDQVLARTARTRRRPAWRVPERWLPMSAITTRAAAAPRVALRLVVALALLVLALVVGAILLAGNQQRRELPAPFGPAANGLVAYAADGDIYTVDTATGDTRAIVAGPAVDRDPAFSLDGTRLAFVREDDDGDRMYTVAASGADVTLVTPEPLRRIDSVSFSPDGREVMFVSGLEPASTISIARIDGSRMRTLELDVRAIEPAFRPADGAQIVFAGAGREGGIYRVNADGSGLTTLIDPALGASSGRPRWSPDGSQIAYSVVDLTVPHWTVQTHVMSADGDGDRTLPAPGDATWSYRPVWSNDGTRLAMLRGYTRTGYQDVSIAIVPADGSGTGIETDRLDLGYEPVGLEWAPDDTAILVTPRSPDVQPARQLLVDAETGTVQTVSWATSSRPAWQRLAP